MSVSWMLLKKSGRQSFVRLGLTTVAVALEIVLVCYFTAGVNGLIGRVNGLAINVFYATLQFAPVSLELRLARTPGADSSDRDRKSVV